MKSLLLLSLALSPLAQAAAQEPIQPDPRYSHVLSSSGPLSREQLLKTAPPAPMSRAARGDANIELMSVPGPATYTYLRCYYRTGGSATKPTTDYAWALDPSSGDYYRLNGYWWSSSALDWKNMYYTDVAQSTLQSVCRGTLQKKGIQQNPAMVFAADNQLSFNYTVWTNDKAGQGAAINKIVAFGDSLSDNQNVYNASMWTLPNRNSWFLGHFSNGQVWVEYLAGRLQLPVYNWAVGGAGVDTQKLVIPGVQQQVQSWKDYMKQARDYDPASTLFTMLIGGNDFVNYNNSVDKVISGQSQALTSLIDAGARNILVLNLPDVSRAPVFQFKSGATQVAAQVRDYNQRLNALAAQLRLKYGSGLNLRVFDSYALFNQVLGNPAQYQFSNTTQSCLDINADSGANYLSAQNARANCVNPDSFVFWDTLHPTTRTHKVLADEVYGFLNGRAGFAALPRR
ncbi:SGNH/GDSL hydrolase family protein [Chromobacterium aquaticum]|uniref:SGNH/GDSL hydrolase family protein n=1 Tax=Chromobacterium aquaticum TaxID=467180 RepID=A0ABV8ZRK4_9NEIS|nr:SGNH/GDSL hydrolase family protein [Chromobacterium aquaticum]MCD5360727.1 SGNH/GDSL hydrolase family protein [Chromobacterium aquaticum]